MEPKFIIKSWTFWFGVAQIGSAVLGFLSGAVDQEAALALLVTGLGTIGFRLKTEAPVSVLPQE